MKKIFVGTLLLLTGVAFGIFLGFWFKKIPPCIKECDVITEKSTTYRNFPPEFWDDHYNDQLDNWNTYISLDNKIAFKYPNNLIVFQENEKGNIYIFPLERIKQQDFDLTRGFVLIIEKYGDYEIQLEDTSQVVDYSIDEFRTEDFFEEISGVIFFNKVTNSHIVKAEPSGLDYRYIYSVYKNKDEQEIGRLIVSTIVTDTSFELGKYRNFSTNNQEIYPKQNGNRLLKSDNLGVMLNVPSGYEFEENMKPDNKSYSVTLSNNTCSLSISNNPEYVGFSTSGALCANAGLNSCLMFGNYFIPFIGNHISIVEDKIQNRAVGYRGVVYGEGLSASLSAPVSETTCVSEMLDTLYSLQPN